MSVLKSKRTESKAEFVYTANQIYIETINFLSRLSARYSRLLASNIADLASEVLANAEKAQNVYPSDEDRIVLRKEYLLKARASLSALDVHLTHCYQIMMMNPEGCFEKSKSPSNAKEKLDKMAHSLGTLIDSEAVLLTNVLKSDKGRK